jgi:hypothetical protein
MKIDEKKIEERVGKLRASHDELTHLIKSDPDAALKLIDKARGQLYELVSAYDDMLQSKSGKNELVFEELILYKAVRDAVAALDGSKIDVKTCFNGSHEEACTEFGVDASDEAKRATYKMYMKVFTSVLEALANWDSETWNR